MTTSTTTAESPLERWLKLKKGEGWNGDLVRRFREELGLTRDKMAAELATHERTLYRWEVEGQKIRASNGLNIAQFVQRKVRKDRIFELIA